MIVKQGIPAAPGVAIGPALVLDTEEYRIPRRTVHHTEVGAQISVLDGALESSRQEVQEVADATTRKLGAKTGSIFAFHKQMLGDPKLRESVVEMIRKQGYTAAYGFGQEMNRLQRMFLAAPDPYIRERVVDLYDIEKRVLRHILGRAREDITKLSEPVVVVAHDLTPSQAAGLDTEHVLGFAIDVGGQTSHTSIIARMLGIPAVVALNNVTSDLSGGEMLIIDGTHGITVCNPDQENIRRYRERAVEYGKFQRSLEVLRDLPSVTRDGTNIHLYANIELPEETRGAMQTGAEGVGLYRSEFLFIANDTLPTEEEQYQTLRRSVRHARGNPFVIRTADFGADKHIPALKQESEANPFLGLRSIRLCLSDLNMFQTHLRAILRASALGHVKIMFPLVTNLQEIRQAKLILRDVMEDLDEESIAYDPRLEVGIMIETPAAALTAASLAQESSFFSIGTNDLIQYTLAVDRGNEHVSALYSAVEPAVIRLIRTIIQDAHRHGIDVSVCGEMASEPEYIMLLVGLGIRTLSMTPPMIPEIKQMIRSVTIEDCNIVARKVLGLATERQVNSFLRSTAREVIPEAI